MENTLFEWLTQIPQTIANFSSWLTSPIKANLPTWLAALLGNNEFFSISPLGLIGIAGFTACMVVLGIHIVRLFI